MPVATMSCRMHTPLLSSLSSLSGRKRNFKFPLFALLSFTRLTFSHLLETREYEKRKYEMSMSMTVKGILYEGFPCKFVSTAERMACRTFQHLTFNMKREPLRERRG